jgi:hypothetical protein
MHVWSGEMRQTLFNTRSTSTLAQSYQTTHTITGNPIAYAGIPTNTFVGTMRATLIG